jgi:hypothetical protein
VPAAVEKPAGYSGPVTGTGPALTTYANQQSEVLDLMRKLMSGEVKWADLSPQKQRLIVTTAGLDPSAKLTADQIETAVKAYVASVENANATAPGEIPIQAPDVTAPTAAAEDPWKQAIADMYIRLWGEPPPEKWLQRALDSGKNLFELELEERAKPAFMHTKTAQDEYAQLAAQLAQALGLR